MSAFKREYETFDASFIVCFLGLPTMFSSSIPSSYVQTASAYVSVLPFRERHMIFFVLAFACEVFAMGLSVEIKIATIISFVKFFFI